MSGMVLVSPPIQTRASEWQGTYDAAVQRNKELLREEIKPLLWYPTVYFAVYIMPLANRWVCCSVR